MKIFDLIPLPNKYRCLLKRTRVISQAWIFWPNNQAHTSEDTLTPPYFFFEHKRGAENSMETAVLGEKPIQVNLSEVESF